VSDFSLLSCVAAY